MRVLLFQKRFHAGLVSKAVTLTVRQWEKPHVKVGGRYRVHPIGVVEVHAVAQVPLAELTETDARRAGFVDLAELTSWMTPVAKTSLGPSSRVWKVELEHVGDGDRIELATRTALSKDDVADLTRRLARLDARPDGPWVRQTLGLIARRPQVAASRLARSIGRETEPFKVDVRKLKKLGLTVSFEVGYELSPRCRAFLKKRICWETSPKR